MTHRAGFVGRMGPAQGAWYKTSRYKATATDGSTVFPTWIFDGTSQRYAKSSSPTGSSSQVAFSSLLENFTRASDATYFDASGTLQTAGTNVPRFTYDTATLQPLGLMVEEARTNILLNSSTLSTQSVTVSATAYTLSFYGTGTVTLSGTSTAGPLVGTGVNSRVTLTFTPSSGTLTLTVSGTVRYANLEAGSTATSHIPTTGSTVTRARDSVTTSDVSWFNESEGTFVIQWQRADTTSSPNFGRMVSVNAGNSNNTIDLYANRPSAQRLGAFIRSGGVTGADTGSSGAASFIGGLNKSALVYKNNYTVAANNGVLGSVDTTVTIPTGMSKFDIFQSSGNLAFEATHGLVVSVFYYPKSLTDAEIQRLTAL